VLEGLKEREKMYIYGMWPWKVKWPWFWAGVAVKIWQHLATLTVFVRKFQPCMPYSLISSNLSSLPFPPLSIFTYLPSHSSPMLVHTFPA
jgi:hypothetical protein